MAQTHVTKQKPVRFIFYGNLKHKKRFSSFLPQGTFQKVKVYGLQMHKLRTCPAVVKKNNYIYAQLWTFVLSPWQKRLLLFILDLIEGVYITRFTRQTMMIQNQKAYIYIYNWSVQNKPIIHEW
ncbi:MAG: hypothetical protein ACMXYF_02835 [Candidatus Woesearchaeota archaeon]